MLNLFRRTRPALEAAALAAPLAPAATHVLRDRYTGQELTRGTLEHCRAYQAAFGLAVIDAL